MIRMTSYKDKPFNEAISSFRLYEAEIKSKWGGRKRLFKCVDVQLEIKFCKAEILFEESLVSAHRDKKIQMIDMMNRAYAALINKAIENGHKELSQDHRCYQFDKDKIAIVCDYDSELPLMKNLYGKDKNVILYSVEELFRLVTPLYMDMKLILKKRDIDGTFIKVKYK